MSATVVQQQSANVIPEPCLAFHLPSTWVGLVRGNTGNVAHVMHPARKQGPLTGRSFVTDSTDHRSSFVATMTVGENPEAELEIKEVPPQEDEDEDEPGVTPGGGRFPSPDLTHFPS